MKPDAAAPLRLPDRVKSLFQEYDPDVLDWEADRDLIIGRVLSAGDWKSIKWLRAQLGDANLRAWIEALDGDHLSSRQLRFWELILDLPADRVDARVATRRPSIWEKRTAP